MSPLVVYRSKVTRGELQPDEAQQQAIQALDDLYLALMSGKSPPSIKGIYLWGDVGRGKTFLMDVFYQSLGPTLALRLHFHHFMQRVHRDLMRFTGRVNPLTWVAKDLAQECRVLCFDEFFVSDIADAMLLGGLLEALFAEGVILVATSNIPLAQLFQSQLQKQRFQPSIALLQAHVQPIHLQGAQDHRLTSLRDVPRYYLDEQILSERFQALTQGAVCDTGGLSLQGRVIPVVCHTPSIAWFHFDDLCDSPRSALDYMALATRFHTIFISRLPELSNTPFEHIKARGTEDGAIGSGLTGERCVTLGIHDNAVRRFISLVDECYDRQVVLYVSAAVPLEKLYQNGALQFEFRRTYSRLMQMQTASYRPSV